MKQIYILVCKDVRFFPSFFLSLSTHTPTHTSCMCMKRFVGCIMLFPDLTYFCPPDLFDCMLFVQTTNRKRGKIYGQAFSQGNSSETDNSLEKWSPSSGLLFVVLVLNHLCLSATPHTVAHQAPLSMGFPRQEYWKVLFQGIFPTQGLDLSLLHW